MNLNLNYGVSEEKPDEDKYSIRDKKQHTLVAISSNQISGRRSIECKKRGKKATSTKSFTFCPSKN